MKLPIIRPLALLAAMTLIACTSACCDETKIHRRSVIETSTVTQQDVMVEGTPASPAQPSATR